MSRKYVIAMLFAFAASGAFGGETLDDPTRPSHLAAAPTTRASEAAGWRVDSIIVSAGRRIAIINGRAVAENETVGGARVLEIQPYQVRLEYKGEIRQISLVPTRVKRPATEQ